MLIANPAALKHPASVKVLFGFGNPLKVFKSVIASVSILVISFLSWAWMAGECHQDKSMEHHVLFGSMALKLNLTVFSLPESDQSANNESRFPPAAMHAKDTANASLVAHLVVSGEHRRREPFFHVQNHQAGQYPVKL